MTRETTDTDSRLQILEEKLEYQDYTVEKLNDVIIAQQRQLDRLEEDLQSLRTSFIEAGFAGEDGRQKRTEPQS